MAAVHGHRASVNGLITKGVWTLDWISWRLVAGRWRVVVNWLGKVIMCAIDWFDY
jgi:hypothetical protein